MGGYPSQPRPNAPLIEVEGLTVGYRAQSGTTANVLNTVSLDLRRGESLGLVGESGCGKSTLAFALMGYLRAGSRVVSGGVKLDGRDLFELAPGELRLVRGGKVALVPQDAGHSLTPTMRVGDQVAETSALHEGLVRKESGERAVELLEVLGLPDPARIARRYPHELSGGQQQRVAIAVALAGGPEALVLDEPTTGLDSTTQVRILDLLEQVRERTGAAMVYVSHDLGVIARSCERAAVMYAGEVAEFGEVSDVLARPAHPYSRGLTSSRPRIGERGLPRALPGRPPAPDERPQGCSFAARCRFATDVCEDAAPLPQRVNGAARPLHLARCHHWARVLGTPSLRPKPVPRGDRSRGGRISEEAATPLLEVRDLTVSYAPQSGARTALRRLRGMPEPPVALSSVDLTVERGETMALVGESGSGKSTLARAIAGLQAPRGGRVRFRGEELAPSVDRRQRELRRAVQLVFQNPDASLNPRHTVSQILERPLQVFFGLGRAERRRRVVALLEEVRLGDRYLSRYPAQLSGGEKQRVAIARALAAEPELILCDEVVSALDVSVQAAVLELLAELQAERGVAYLFIAHDLAVVRAISDRVAVLRGGQLQEVGATEAIYSPPHHPYTGTLLAAALEAGPEVTSQVRRTPHAAGADTAGANTAGADAAEGRR